MTNQLWIIYKTIERLLYILFNDFMSVPFFVYIVLFSSFFVYFLIALSQFFSCICNFISKYMVNEYFITLQTFKWKKPEVPMGINIVWPCDIETCTIITYFVHNTVKIFNSCTSRPDVCQYLVVKTHMDNMSRKYAKHMNDPRCLWIKATFSCEVIHALMPRKLGDDRACGRVLCPGCPRI